MGPSKLKLPIAVAFCSLVALGAVAIAEECEFDINEKRKLMVLEDDCTTEETILIPDGFTLDGYGHRITAVESFEGGWLGPIVKNEGSWAGVERLALRTKDLACICAEGDDRLSGISLDGADGVIRNNAILSMTKGECGCQEGIGIFAKNEPFDGSVSSGQYTKVKIIGNTLQDYQKGGIVVSGAVDAVVRYNVAEGQGPTGAIAQNGIQMSYGALGEVSNNTAVGHISVGSGLATGVLIFEASKIEVERNSILFSEVGIAIESWGWLAAAANSNEVERNIITSAEVGISIAAREVDETTVDPTASRNKVSFNSIINAFLGDTGIQVEEDDCSGCVKRTRLSDNLIRGFDDDIDFDLESDKSAGGREAGEVSGRPVPVQP